MTPTCAYCRAPFDADEEVVACPACGTVHHGDCLRENGGCTVFGCSEAPVEEPKISVSAHEVLRLRAPTRPTAAAPPTVPPPPRIPGPPPPPRPDAPAIRMGAPPSSFSFGGYANVEPVADGRSIYISRKNRVTFVVLAIFFGVFGVHNFYAGYVKKAVIQCCLTIFTGFLASPVVWVWAIVEACMVNRDDDGVAFT
jgi:TM2 domain-containing membrane protein YozV